MAANAWQSAHTLFLGRHDGGEASDTPVGEVDDHHGRRERRGELQRMHPPAVLRREEADQALEQRHSGVWSGAAAPSLCAALAERRASGELRTAPAAQRVHPDALRRHFAQDRPLHRDEERQ
jgi:hypothetical protein